MDKEKDWIDVITDASNEILSLRKLGFSDGDRMIQIQLEIIQEAVNSMVPNDPNESAAAQSEERLPPWAFEIGPEVH